MASAADPCKTLKPGRKMPPVTRIKVVGSYCTSVAINRSLVMIVRFLRLVKKRATSRVVEPSLR